MTPAQKATIVELYHASKSRRTAFNPTQFIANLQTIIGDVGPLIEDILAALAAAGVITPAPAPTPAPTPTN